MNSEINSNIINSIVVNRSLLTSPDADMAPDLLAARMSLEANFASLLDQVEKIEAIKDNVVALKELLDYCKQCYFFYDRIQLTAKVNANAMYGALGAPFFRYYKRCVAADITAEGRNAVKMLDDRTTKYLETGWPKEIEFFNEMKAKYPALILADAPVSVTYKNGCVVYGDTDSLFFTLDNLLKSMGVPQMADTRSVTMLIVDIMQGPIERLHKELLRRYAVNRNCKDIQVFELEAVLRRGIFLAKKKYVCSYLWKDGKYIAKELKLKGTGIELSQKTTPHMIKEVIKKYVYYMLSSKKLDDEVYFEYSYAIQEKFAKTSIDLWAKSRGLGKYDKYHSINSKGKYIEEKGADICAKGANWYNNLVISKGLQQKYPLIRQGSKIKFYVTNTGETFSYPIDDDAEFPHEIAPPPDVRANLKKLLFDPVSRILSKITTADLTLIGSDAVSKKVNPFTNR